MLLRLLLRILALAVIIGLTAAIVPGIHVHGGVGWLVVVAIVFAVVNAVLGPVFILFGLPLIVLTFGAFLFVVNALLLAITAGLSDHLDVDNVGSALLGGLLITIGRLLVGRLWRRDRPQWASRRGVQGRDVQVWWAWW
jgi:putative membrane protein